MLKLGRVTKVKVFFLVQVYVFSFDLFEFSAAILEKGLLQKLVSPVCEHNALMWCRLGCSSGLRRWFLSKSYTISVSL